MTSNILSTKISTSLLNCLQDDCGFQDVLSKIKSYGVNFVEVPVTYVLGKSWDDIRYEDIYKLKKDLEYCELKVISFQSISFGLNYDICHMDKNQKIKVFDHFKKVSEYGSFLGINHVVYGSPSTRTGADIQKYVNFFHELSSLFYDNDIKLCLENNSRSWGCNFGYKASDLSIFIENNSLSNTYVNLDYGNSYLELEDINSKIDNVISIHISKMKNNDLSEGSDFHSHLRSNWVEDGIFSVSFENLIDKSFYFKELHNFINILPSLKL